MSQHAKLEACASPPRAGLTSAMYLPACPPAGLPSSALAALELPCPDATTGLHVRTRSGAVVRVTVPKGQLLFQAGQCLQVLSGGRFRATEHCVLGPEAPLAVSRNTFAVFCQPKCASPASPISHASCCCERQPT
jgi:isopenicillin N synthase-like dioxygenase